MSSTKIDFGTQFVGGLRLPRYLYLSNNSPASIPHASVTLSPSSPFLVTDRCPTLLESHTVCQIQIDYQSPQTSFDSVTLSLDQGIEVLVTGKTIPQQGTGGETVNPNLVVAPAALNFPNAVAVTGTSANTLTATLSNNGPQPFPLAVSLTGDFIDSSDCTGTLNGGASCSVVVTFTPSQPGTRQGLLSVSTGAGSTPAYVNLSGTALPILPTNNGVLDLGDSAVGQPVVQWYKISQPFSRLTATIDGDFRVLLVEDIGYGHGQPAASAFTSTATGSCTNCWLGVQFLPSSASEHQGALTFASSSSGAPYRITVTGNGLPLNGLLLTPVQQDFGPVAVHSSSASSLFTLTNLTPTNATFTGPAVTGDFVLRNDVTGGPSCIGTVAPGASCFVQVAFAPTATGPAAGTLTLHSDNGTAAAALTGFGAPDRGLSLNPTALNFQNVPSPSATQQIITVSNTGTDDLQIGSLGSNSASFHTVTTCSTLLPGNRCTVTVTFVPTTATISAVLSIPVTSSAPGSPQTTYSVPLSGMYTAEDSGLQILPAVAAFGPTATTASGIVRQVLVNNLTTQQVNLSLSLPRQFSLTTPPCSTLGAGQGCAFSVAFTPFTNGDVTGTVFARATPVGGGPSLNGIGYVEGFGTGQASLSVTGDLLPENIVQFGQVPSGQTSSRTLILTNRGTSLMTVRRSTSEWPFLSATTCGHPLSPGDSCTVALTYAPLNQVATGSSPAPFNTDAGSLVIESDAASSPELLQLTGTVTPQYVAIPLNRAPIYAYTASQGSLHFEPTRAGEASTTQTLMLANTGTSTVHIRDLIVSSDFVVAGNCPSIIPGASCPLQVSFTPQASSSQTPNTILGALEVVSDSSTSLDFVSLSGTATPSTLGLSPASLDFGSVLLGGSATLRTTLTNYSGTPAVFHNITVNGDYGVQGNCPPSGSQLAPSAACTLQITFKPSQAGVRPGAVTVSTSLTTLPLTVDLTGVGTQPHLLSTPGSLSFSDTTLGTSTSLTLSLTNSGTGPVSSLGFSTFGDYSIQKPCGVTTLSPGGRCDLTIAFTPKSAGSRSGTLRVTSSDSGSPLAVALTGNGVAPKSFSLSVDANTLTIKSGQPAGYHLSITPLNGFTGTVVLNCTPVQAARYATCSLLPSTINLTGASSQTSVATLNTVMKVTAASKGTAASLAFLALPLGVLFTRRGSRAILFLLLLSGTILCTSGCGSGGTVIINEDDPNLRYTPPGTYQYSVTATAVTGTPISQSLTLKLVVTAK